ncbi:hypothetical protein RclHR1_01010001 [Rhizophagus clarus]|uniref:Uncharacterized protein n=1 Tax=Rhizophagus clarus TaxID=94130 RepID=A0A2Z6Q0P9_9GLOM|nr:hypothetical protein RclHR1_01010001 [Rhizophagus clarus]
MTRGELLNKKYDWTFGIKYFQMKNEKHNQTFRIKVRENEKHDQIFEIKIREDEKHNQIFRIKYYQMKSMTGLLELSVSR